MMASTMMPDTVTSVVATWLSHVYAAGEVEGVRGGGRGLGSTFSGIPKVAAVCVFFEVLMARTLRAMHVALKNPLRYL